MSTKISSRWSVPAHITGLFQIVEHENPLQMGSRGAGFSLSSGIITTIKLSQSSNIGIKVFYNEKEIDGKVSLAVVENFQEQLKNSALIIEHSSDFPMQAGFGTSGAGAIGTAFALNELLGNNKSNLELGQIAHKAEVSCRTGLGDVIAQMNGFAEMRLEPGAPGIGVIEKLDWPEEEMILTATLGTLSTKDIITNPQMIQKINTYSKKLLEELKSNPTLDEFLRVSYLFASETGLLDGSLKDLIEYLRNENYFTSMIMLGKSLFVVGKFEDLEECRNIINNYNSNAKIWINSISNIGPTVL
ncbi:MAG: hypothetical protein EAX90_02405 [Candidatus Heimdallarchaeota archaeon]|nr:hypothetical protein [Candidatus Heimdallarchaeota archaeon]